MKDKWIVEDLEMIVREMHSTQMEHPKAKIYFYPEDNEIRIAYPLPHDLKAITGGFNPNRSENFNRER